MCDHDAEVSSSCLYLAAAAWQSLHPCRHPPSASSPALWSVFPLRSLQPPSYFSRLETPLLKSQVSGRKKRMEAGLFGGRLLSDRCRHLCSWSINCPQPTLDNVWVFSNLRRGFWASSAHLTEENQWSARTGVFRAELKMRGNTGIHHCRRGLTFWGTLLSQRKMNIGSSAYHSAPLRGAFKREACKAT